MEKPYKRVIVTSNVPDEDTIYPYKDEMLRFYLTTHGATMVDGNLRLYRNPMIPGGLRRIVYCTYFLPTPVAAIHAEFEPDIFLGRVVFAGPDKVSIDAFIDEFEKELRLN